MPRYVLCVIANDAADGDDRKNHYTGVGPNFAQRIFEAVEWQQRALPTAKHVWAFGAGMDEQHRNGPTLAQCCETAIRVLCPAARTITNCQHYTSYGTFEEMEWMVWQVAKSEDRQNVRFVFFTQKRHMYRVRLIWSLFYQKQWGNALFVVTSQTKEIPLSHELKAWGKVIALRLGLTQPRSAQAYVVKT